MSWIDAWEEQRTPWDLGRSPPVLEELVERDDLSKGRALVPGCGSGYDVLTLASPDRRAIGLDLAAGAAERFESLRSEAGVPPEQAEVRTEDFFEFDVDAPFDLVWDYTFLCAIEPERREDWVERCEELLRPKGELVTLLFPVYDRDRPVSADEDGPPYRLTPDFAASLIEPTFDCIELHPVETSTPERQGKEWLGRWRAP